MPLELQGLSESNMKQFLCARNRIKGISNLFIRWMVNQMSQPHFGSIKPINRGRLEFFCLATQYVLSFLEKKILDCDIILSAKIQE